MNRFNHLLPVISIALVGMLGFSPTAAAQTARRGRLPATGTSVTFAHAETEREYRNHLPRGYDKEKPVSLVVCLHGGGGNSAQMSRFGMTPVADRHGFIVVYPNAIDKHWNDGRTAKIFAEHDAKIDDVAFIKAVVDRVKREYRIDENRVFATGASNGGFMSQRLAIELPEIFSAVGIVIASMGEPLSRDFAPKLPVSVLYMNGTTDPLVPYGGGPVRVNLLPRLNQSRNADAAPRGRCIATDDAVRLWVKRNKIAGMPRVTKLPDKDPNDGSKVELSLWTGGDKGTAVALYRVEGGGHTVPGTIQYLPARIIGTTNRDIDGFETIWQFFKEHARQPRGKSD